MIYVLCIYILKTLEVKTKTMLKLFKPHSPIQLDALNSIITFLDLLDIFSYSIIYTTKYNLLKNDFIYS